MIEICLKYDNMHVFGIINAFNCINNHVINVKITCYESPPVGLVQSAWSWATGCAVGPSMARGKGCKWLDPGAAEATLLNCRRLSSSLSFPFLIIFFFFFDSSAAVDEGRWRTWADFGRSCGQWSEGDRLPR